jgi:hypothetical protein
VRLVDPVHTAVAFLFVGTQRRSIVAHMRHLALAVLILATMGLSSALAHFKLNAPASMTVQDGTGNPQKSAPCGLSDSATVADQSTKTNAVTMAQAGTFIRVEIAETITHPGHYRVAIAQTMAQLPADPPVTAGTMACGTTTIMSTPIMPVLADGLFVHTAAFGGPQTAMVPLPPGFTCTNCVLQVEQFMSNHGLNNPGGCFYHHCATVTITDTPPPVDGPPTSGDDAGNNNNGGGGGGGCSTHGGASLLVGVGLMALLLSRTRRVRSR